MDQPGDNTVKDIQSLADLELDGDNANLGTERGMWTLQESVIRFGVGRGIVVDRRGRVIGGNKTTETLEKLNPGVKVVVVPSDGDTLVVTQRTDLDLVEDPAARELAFADNRVGELNLAWDAQQIAAGMEAGLDLAAFFRQGELDNLALPDDALTGTKKGSDADLVPEMEVQPFEHYDYVMLVFRNTWDWARAVDVLDVEPRAFAFTSSKGEKHRKIGLCRVLDGATFLQKVEQWKSAS
ncbi:MAG: hypothetical protein JXR84_13090 [Anaerolineae bacterium]|nr:hypothetical protein [Anaerolineae bacterium]